jgi:hypothetical protein
MTNEERFNASCELVGEADVRAKLSAGRYSERKTEWASSWLETVESGKSDATRAEESSSQLRSSRNARPYFYAVSAIVIVLLVTGVTVLLRLG